MSRRRRADLEARGSASDDAYDGWEDASGEEVHLPSAEEWRGRAVLVLTSSYGVSALIHLGLLLVALFVFWTTTKPEPEKRALAAAFERKEPPYEPEQRRDMKRTPPIPMPPTEIPVPVKSEEPPNETPKGLSMDNHATKDFDSTDTVDAFGVSGGAPGLRGDPLGFGPPGPGSWTPASESAVRAALWWLKRHQHPDGHWSAAGFHERCDAGGRCDGPDLRSRTGRGPGGGDEAFDVGVTGLALLAFLGNGHTHLVSKVPEFQVVVRRGVTFLKKAQGVDGSLGFSDGEDIYNHAIATMALAEAYGMSRDFTLKRSAQSAVDWLVKAQNPGLGWKYGVQPGRNDTSVTGWAVLALKAGTVAGLDVPRSAFEGALTWLERATTDGAKGRQAGLVGYERPGDGGSVINRRALARELGYEPAVSVDFRGAPTMTAVAVLCRVFAHQGLDHERVRQGLSILMDNMPRWDGPARSRENQTSFYYWYYATYGVFQATRLGSKEWLRWNDAMQQALLGDGTNRQRMGGCSDGSWDPIDEWGLSGGRVYATAMNALTLEIYYRYERASAKAGAKER